MHWVRMCASHCLDSGTDSTSAFCGKGKKVPLDLLEQGRTQDFRRGAERRGGREEGRGPRGGEGGGGRNPPKKLTSQTSVQLG